MRASADQSTPSILTRVQSHRHILISLGLLIVLIGIVMVVLPFLLLRSTAIIISIGLIASATVKAGQFVFGKSKRGYSFRAICTIALQIIIDLLLASLLLRNSTFSLNTLGLMFGLIFLVDGMMQTYVGWRAPSARSRVLFFASGMFTMLLAILIIIRSSAFRIEWIGLLMGVKLISFGIVLITIALRSKSYEDPIIYTDIDTSVIEKKPAELYACYFGTAFHLGIYIGNDEVVHYRDDNLVHRTSWEEFLKGREPQHWYYPDIPIATNAEVIKTAIDQVGKTSKYSLLKNNCEHFAIYCKTGGKTQFSKYAQIPSAIENVSEHPIAGTVVEIYSRIAEWIGFHIGGTLGRKAGLKIREFSSLLTAWMLSASDLKKVKR